MLLPRGLIYEGARNEPQGSWPLSRSLPCPQPLKIPAACIIPAGTWSLAPTAGRPCYPQKTCSPGHGWSWPPRAGRSWGRGVAGGGHREPSCMAALCHPQHTVIADHSLSASHMETTMKLLKTRVQSRLALHKQFASLGKWCQSGLWPELLSPRTKTTEPCAQIS